MTPEEFGAKLEALGRALQNPSTPLQTVVHLACEAGVRLEFEMLPVLAAREEGGSFRIIKKGGIYTQDMKPGRADVYEEVIK